MKTFSKHALSPSSAKRAGGRKKKVPSSPPLSPPFFSHPNSVIFYKVCPTVRECRHILYICARVFPHVAGSSRTAQLQSVLPLLFTLDYPDASKHFTSAPFTGVCMWLCVRARLCVHAHMRMHTL